MSKARETMDKIMDRKKIDLTNIWDPTTEVTFQGRPVRVEWVNKGMRTRDGWMEVEVRLMVLTKYNE